MSNSARPHRWQPTRLPRPWDSPGKNTGVDCHFLLQCMKVKSESEVAQMRLTLSDPRDCNLPGSSIHGIVQARVLEWGAIAFSDLSVYLKIRMEYKIALFCKLFLSLSVYSQHLTKHSTKFLWVSTSMFFFGLFLFLPGGGLFVLLYPFLSDIPTPQNYLASEYPSKNWFSQHYLSPKQSQWTSYFSWLLKIKEHFKSTK